MEASSKCGTVFDVEPGTPNPQHEVVGTIHEDGRYELQGGDDADN